MQSAADRNREFYAEDNGRAGNVAYLTARSAEALLGKAKEAAGAGARKLMRDAVEAATLYQQMLVDSVNTMTMARESCLGFANALNQVQFLYLDTLRRAGRHDGRRSYLDFLHCRSLVDIAELQRDVYQGTVKDAVEISTSALRIMGEASRDAIAPLREKV